MYVYSCIWMTRILDSGAGEACQGTVAAAHALIQNIICCLFQTKVFCLD